MLRAKETLSVGFGHTKEPLHYFRGDREMNRAPVTPFTDTHHLSETGTTPEKPYIKQTHIT